MGLFCPAPPQAVRVMQPTAPRYFDLHGTTPGGALWSSWDEPLPPYFFLPYRRRDNDVGGG